MATDTLQATRDATLAEPGVFDYFDAFLRAHGGGDFDEPLEHQFTPDQYIRTVTMRPGIYVLTKKHTTEHPFFILKGEVRVFEMVDGQPVYLETLRAGHRGITRAGTQRALETVSECVWSTVWALVPADFAGVSAGMDPLEARRIVIRNLEARLAGQHANPLLINP